jgi:hypothetical protein
MGVSLNNNIVYLLSPLLFTFPVAIIQDKVCTNAKNQHVQQTDSNELTVSFNAQVSITSCRYHDGQLFSLCCTQ